MRTPALHKESIWQLYIVVCDKTSLEKVRKWSTPINHKQLDYSSQKKSAESSVLSIFGNRVIEKWQWDFSIDIFFCSCSFDLIHAIEEQANYRYESDDHEYIYKKVEDGVTDVGQVTSQDENTTNSNKNRKVKMSPQQKENPSSHKIIAW